MFKEIFKRQENKTEEKELPKHFSPEKQPDIENYAADIEGMLREQNISEKEISHEQINDLFRDNEEEFRRIYNQNPKELLQLIKTVAIESKEAPEN